MPKNTTDAAELPDSWKPAEPQQPDIVEIPGVDFTDPAMLAAWYGNFGFYEGYRKVVLANCRELERAKAVAKTTESRLDDLARNNPLYLEFMRTHLVGRHLYEREVLRRGIGG